MDEFKKLVYSNGFFLKLTKDIFCFEIIKLIFPQFKNINIFKKLNNFAKKNINKLDFIFLISLMIIDGQIMLIILYINLIFLKKIKKEFCF